MGNSKSEKEWDTFIKSIWDANQLMPVPITRKLTLTTQIPITLNADQRKTWATIIPYADNVATIQCAQNHQPGGTQQAERNGLTNKSFAHYFGEHSNIEFLLPNDTLKINPIQIRFFNPY